MFRVVVHSLPLLAAGGDRVEMTLTSGTHANPMGETPNDLVLVTLAPRPRPYIWSVKNE